MPQCKCPDCTDDDCDQGVPEPAGTPDRGVLYSPCDWCHLSPDRVCRHCDGHGFCRTPYTLTGVKAAMPWLSPPPVARPVAAPHLPEDAL